MTDPVSNDQPSVEMLGAPASATVVKAPASAGETADARIGTVLVGRYRIDELLGSGGMGAVYRAEHLHMRKTFAVKVLHPEMTHRAEVVARFEREAIAAARIEHPHVTSATDFGRLDDGSFYLVLEYIQGTSLRELLQKQQRLPATRALHIARQIAEALGAAHQLGIVHRDLKPDNVMLIAKDGEADFVKVLDFGLAKVQLEDQKQKLTQMGSIFGTPEYMAPEQAQGAEVDARGDLYTLGIVVYEMLAGNNPFAAEDMMAVLMSQLTLDPPPLPDDIEPRVSELVMGLLRKLPAQRPQSAAELIAQLDGIIGIPESQKSAAAAAAVPKPEETKRTLRVAIAVVLAALLFGGLLWIFAADDSAAEDEALLEPGASEHSGQPASRARSDRAAATPREARPEPAAKAAANRKRTRAKSDEPQPTTEEEETSEEAEKIEREAEEVGKKAKREWDKMIKGIGR
jgi:serine/threonine-protein kinase